MTTRDRLAAALIWPTIVAMYGTLCGLFALVTFKFASGGWDGPYWVKPVLLVGGGFCAWNNGRSCWRAIVEWHKDCQL